MAIVQISRITHRKGLQEDLPQLAGAELGWSIDSQRLFIGNGDLDEGAPTIGNTEILTENSDIFNLIGSYTYKGAAGGYIVQTGPVAGDDVTRSLQSKLDDFASVRDFGALGDGVTDDTAAINRALFQLFCRESTVSSRRSLFFPAGTYRVTDTILIPSYAKLYGEGKDSSVITLSANEWSIVADYSAGDRVFVTGEGFYQAQQASTSTAVTALGTTTGTNKITLSSSTGLAAGQRIVFSGSGATTAGLVPGTAYYILTVVSNDITVSTTPSGSTVALNTSGDDFTGIAAFDTTVLSYWQIMTIPAVAITTDDNQTYGLAGSGSRQIEVHSMGFRTIFDEIDVFVVDSADNCQFHEVEFSGPFAQPPSTGSNPYSCVTISSPSADKICTDILLDGCRFTGMKQGFFADNLSKAITISNSAFDNLYRGVILDDNVGGDSPTGVRVVHNLFDFIYDYGIYIIAATRNISAFNSFYDVANTDGVNLVACIRIEDVNNVSWGDMFARTNTETLTAARIEIVGSVASIGLDMAEKLQMGSYVRDTGQIAVLDDNKATWTTIFSKDAVDNGTDPAEVVIPGFTCEYAIVRSGLVRTGTLHITAAYPDDSTTSLVWNDDYLENEDTGVSLRVTQAGDTVSVQYQTTNLGADAAFTYSCSYLT